MRIFQALKKGITGTPQVLPYPTDLSKHITDPNKDWYRSLFQYTELHKKLIEEKKSFKGIEDTTTDRLVFDLDNKEDVEVARYETSILIGVLIDTGVDPESIQAFFSGMKGFSLEIDINERITPEQFKDIIKNLSSSFKTLDVKITDPVRIIRVPNTKHPESGLFKIPLDIDEVQTMSVNEIKELAKNPRELNLQFTRTTLPKSYITSSMKKTKTATINTTIDWVNKPKEWRNCKWSLLQGLFEASERHYALTVLAATCRGLGYDRETAYYMLKSAIKKQAKRTKQDEFSTDEVWENILESIYSPSWKGGQYSCQNDIWLQEKCESLGEHSCAKDRSGSNTIKITEAGKRFKDYAKNIDKLTIKTGIPVLDERIRMTIGMSVGIVAGPGVGKTSLAVQILNTVSKAGELAIFYSLDMYESLVYQKLAQKHTGVTEKELFDPFKNDDAEFENDLNTLLNEEYGNVEFCFDAGQSIEQIENSIMATEEKTGKKVRFIVVDYNELIITDKNDPTASSAYVAQNLRKIAKTHNCCVLTLLQPSKIAGTPADEITSYRSAKGSSAIEQSLSIMLGVNRPGYDPRNPENDKFMSVTCLKNRMGQLFALDLHWDGVLGIVRELTMEEEAELFELKKKKQENAKAEEWL